MSISRSTKGRPSQPTPIVPGNRLSFGREDRVLWMLRVRLFHGDDQRFAVARNFARAFHGGCMGRAADPAAISRWELAQNQADYLVIRRYEQLLGLETH